MVLTNAYLTAAQLREVMREQLIASDLEYERAIAAASRQIDDYCGRHFWQEAAPVARLFRPDDPCLMFTSDISTTTGLIVETDEDSDGTFETTWAAADYQLEPFERMNGRPYTRLAAVGGRVFPAYRASRSGYGTYGPYAHSGSSYWHSRRARVRITARWGWPAVPSEVVSACQIVAVDHFRSKDLSSIASQYGTGTRFARDVTADAYGRRTGFTRIKIPVLNPEAEMLLGPLRVNVVA